MTRMLTVSIPRKVTVITNIIPEQPRGTTHQDPGPSTVTMVEAAAAGGIKMKTRARTTEYFLQFRLRKKEKNQQTFCEELHLSVFFSIRSVCSGLAVIDH